MKKRWSLRLFVLACFLWVGVLHTQFPIFNLQFSILHAQTFTEHLTRSNAGEGSVILHHDSDIEALVNGRITYANSAPAPRTQTPATPAAVSHPDSLLSGDSSSFDQLTGYGRRMRATGYRVQVYAGGNNRQAPILSHPAGRVAWVTSRLVRKPWNYCSACARRRNSARLRLSRVR